MGPSLLPLWRDAGRKDCHLHPAHSGVVPHWKDGRKREEETASVDPHNMEGYAAHDYHILIFTTARAATRSVRHSV